MVSTSRVILKELRVLERILRPMKVKVYPRWLPSAVNIHADRLFWQWDPVDTQVTRRVLLSLEDTYQIEGGGKRFKYRLIELPAVAQRTVEMALMEEKWGGQRRDPSTLHWTR